MAIAGFDEPLPVGRSKSECYKALLTVFPELDSRTPFIGMLNLIEVVNNCQKKH